MELALLRGGMRAGSVARLTLLPRYAFGYGSAAADDGGGGGVDSDADTAAGSGACSGVDADGGSGGDNDVASNGGESACSNGDMAGPCSAAGDDRVSGVCGEDGDAQDSCGAGVREPSGAGRCGPTGWGGGQLRRRGIKRFQCNVGGGGGGSSRSGGGSEAGSGSEGSEDSGECDGRDGGGDGDDGGGWDDGGLFGGRDSATGGDGGLTAALAAAAAAAEEGAERGPRDPVVLGLVPAGAVAEADLELVGWHAVRQAPCGCGGARLGHQRAAAGAYPPASGTTQAGVDLPLATDADGPAVPSSSRVEYDGCSVPGGVGGSGGGGGGRCIGDGAGPPACECGPESDWGVTVRQGALSISDSESGILTPRDHPTPKANKDLRIRESELGGAGGDRSTEDRAPL
jgi:hypothetical protein